MAAGVSSTSGASGASATSTSTAADGGEEKGHHNLVHRAEIFRSFQTALNAQRVIALVKTAETMGILDSSSEKSKQADVDEILGFLTALEKVLPSEKELKRALMDNGVYNEYNIDELENSFRYLNWRKLLDGLFPKTLQAHEVVIVHNPTYLRKLGRIISLFEPQVIWKSLLVVYAKDVLSDLVTVHHGGQPRWQYCTQVSAMLFGEALSRLYLLQAAPSRSRKRMSQEVSWMFEAVRKEILGRIDSVDWLPPQAKSLARKKIENLRGSFVGSDIYFNISLLESRYQGISMSSDFFANVISMFKHFRSNLYHFLRESVDKEIYTWSLIAFPFTVNAFHLQQLNSIVIPFGLLQNAQYTLNVPTYLNLGSLGLTLAHEALHSLDRTGRDFDGQGSLLLQRRGQAGGQAGRQGGPAGGPAGWWGQAAEKAFENVTGCLVDQYKQHFSRPIRIDARSIMVEVDGEFTLNENICDVDGMKVASDAFLSLPNAPSDLIHLPNNPYTPQQLFYINSAQVYCSHLGPVSYVLHLELDEHAPNPERVDGIMMNSPLFNAVFQCPSGSRMNPKRKCSVWT